jgi:hypothetical protein
MNKLFYCLGWLFVIGFGISLYRSAQVLRNYFELKDQHVGIASEYAFLGFKIEVTGWGVVGISLFYMLVLLLLAFFAFYVSGPAHHEPTGQP